MPRFPISDSIEIASAIRIPNYLVQYSTIHRYSIQNILYTPSFPKVQCSAKTERGEDMMTFVEFVANSIRKTN